MPWKAFAKAKSTSKGNDVVTSRQGFNLVILFCTDPVTLGSGRRFAPIRDKVIDSLPLPVRIRI